MAKRGGGEITDGLRQKCLEAYVQETRATAWFGGTGGMLL